MSSAKFTMRAREAWRDVIKFVVILSIVMIGSMALVISGPAERAAADPTQCATGPGTGAFGSPYFMYEVRWGGNPTAPFKGTAAFNKLSHGGLTQIVWNGVHQNTVSGSAIDATNWYPQMNSALNGTHMEYHFYDGTVWTADATATVDGCLTRVDWNETHPTPVATAACTVIDIGPIATDQDFQGWSFSETRATGHNDFTVAGLHVWTEGATSTDKAAGYRTSNLALKDVGIPGINFGATVGTLPSLQLVTDFNNDGIVDGILVGEPAAYPGGGYWVPDSGSTAPWVKIAAPSVDRSVSPPQQKSPWPAAGSNYNGTLDQWLLQFPDARVLALGYSLGSGVLGSSVIESIDVGCISYGFAMAVVAGSPTVSGLAQVGSILSAAANPSTWGPVSGLTFTYQWNADGVPIAGATASTFKLTSAELGALITVTVTGSAAGYSPASAVGAPTGEVLPAAALAETGSDSLLANAVTALFLLVVGFVLVVVVGRRRGHQN